MFGMGVTWVGLLNFLGIFIILGIGADDLFVILEFWWGQINTARHDMRHTLSFNSRNEGLNLGP